MVDDNVKAVAKAIDPDAWDTRYLDYVYALRAHLREKSIQTARAAIKAHLECLIEPSEFMLQAGQFEIDGVFGPVSLEDRVWARVVWQAMLSAKEKV